jgi:hypothetical protein
MESELRERVRDLLDGFGIKEVLAACAAYCEAEVVCCGAPELELLAREWGQAADLLRRAARNLSL